MPVAEYMSLGGLMKTSLVRAVTEDEIEAYERDGFVILRNIHPQAWVDTLRATIDEVFARDVSAKPISEGHAGGEAKGARMDIVKMAAATKKERPDYVVSADGPADAPMVGRSIVETDAASWCKPMRTYDYKGPLPELIAQLTRSQKVNFYCDQLFLKEPGSRVRSPFHQDKPYFLMQGDKVAVAWVPVDRVDRENSTMCYVRGSHRWGKNFIPIDFVSQNEPMPKFEGVSYEGLVPTPLVEGHEDDFDVVCIDAEPGDVIVHHWATLHGSTGNVSKDRIRRAASVRYAGDDVTYYQSPASPEPFRHSTGLVDGDPLENSARFPVVWPR